MPEIQVITQRIRDLSQSVDWWNSAMIWGLAVAAIAAVFMVVATRIVVNRTGKLSEQQELLNAAKDRQLQADLKGKDIEIGNLKLRSDTAETQIAGAQRGAAEANAKTEALKRDNLELEKSLAPRVISYKEFEDGSTNVDLMKAFPGMETVVEYIPDAESQRAAYNIAFILKQAGWTIVSLSASRGFQPPWDGVTILSYLPKSNPTPSPFEFGRMRVSGDASNALSRFFRENDWEVHGNVADSGSLQLGAQATGQLRIISGFKPSPYFQDPEDKQRQAEEDARLGVNKIKLDKKIRTELLANQGGIVRYIVPGAKPPATRP